ncbi:Lipopolysaccharide biosynthesis protein-like (plasmid) [Tritonibacter mobilis]|uniref:rhamnan synthesis F family protein n=1 Tax=Tritonibacter mobilis TaxID=379347 RepID=UPI000F6E8A11|nr:rhamnan synthesis F family protein [Tritonibacter mobilis]VCU62092.1 Lipopolysaccharide biosynthesis protein-like [Tritonibacter mobilis]
MKKTPLWKVKREVKRLFRQLLELPGVIYEYLFLRVLYDYRASREMKVSEGSRSITGEVAIYLVYAPKGVQPSHLDMLKVMTAENITPIVVSNLPLADADRELLLKQSGLVIERPNIGYDFGGYRDAVMQISSKLSDLDRLYIVNDSVWMVDAPQNWFAEARAAGCDFVGATSNFGIKRYDADDFRNLIWTHSVKHPNFHYASYALSIGQNILKDPKFLAYWKNFRISNNKTRTVRRGEIGLTQWVLQHGYDHCATCDVAALDKEIAALSDVELDAVARHLVILEDLRILGILDKVLESDLTSETGRRDRHQVILMAVARQAIGYALPYFTLRYRKFQFIKKSPLRLSRRGAEATLKIMSDLDGPMAERAYVEAEQIFNQREDL